MKNTKKLSGTCKSHGSQSKLNRFYCGIIRILRGFTFSAFMSKFYTGNNIPNELWNPLFHFITCITNKQPNQQFLEITLIANLEKNSVIQKIFVIEIIYKIM